MNKFFNKQGKMARLLLVGVMLNTSVSMASFEHVDCEKDRTVLGISTLECQALEKLWDSTEGKGWQDNRNWDTLTPVKSWDGVDVLDDKVSSLLLYSNNLKGNIPLELGNLSALKRLSLSNNSLSGKIPDALGNLSQLVYLELSSNQLTGEIPSSFGSLSKLNELYLSNNQLRGSIPDTLGDLEVLNVLKLYENNLSGSIPLTLGALSNLNSLSLSENELTGSIPAELGELSKLSYLDLKSNRLSGILPSSLGNLSRLTGLYLQNNQLRGSIPTQLGSLIRLTDLDLSSNHLRGHIPSALGNISKLAYLNLSDNQLNGQLPSELLSLAILNYLNLKGNRFVFSDIEPYHSVLSYLPTYIVSPQKTVDIERDLTTVNRGESIIIRSALANNPSGNDKYAWYKDGVLIEDATSSVFTKRDVTSVDEGLYTYEVINALVPELTLKSHHESEGVQVNIDNNVRDIKMNSKRRVEELNAITGVSGAIQGIDYSAALEDAYYVDLNNPTAQEIQNVINRVNQSINSKTTAKRVGLPIAIRVLEDEELAFYEVATLKIEGTNNAGDALTVDNEGIWRVDDNKIVFTPFADFNDTPSAIFYTIEKSDGTVSNPIKVAIHQKIIEENAFRQTNGSVTVNILKNEKTDIDLNSVEIVLSEAFMDEHPESLLSEDKRSLFVEKEGVWKVENSGMITFTPEENFVGEPSDISYLVLLNSGNKSTVGTIDIKNKPTVKSAKNQMNNVPTLNTSGILLMMLLSGLFGIFYARKIN